MVLKGTNFKEAYILCHFLVRLTILIYKNNLQCQVSY